MDFTDLIYANGVLKGKVVVSKSATPVPPAGSCQDGIHVFVFLGPLGDYARRFDGWTQWGTGSFAITVPMAETDIFRLQAGAYTDPEAGECAPNPTGELAPDTDDDEDGVPKSLDECERSQGFGTLDGCPSYEREFSLMHNTQGLISGSLRVKGTADESFACSLESSVTLRIGAAPSQRVFTAGVGGPFGKFDFPRVKLADGERYSLEGEVYRNPLAGWCLSGATGERTAVVDTDGDGVRDLVDECDKRPDDEHDISFGCPGIARVFSAVTYSRGVLSGTLMVADKTAVPEGSCSARNVITLQVGTDGDRVEVIGEVKAGSESFEIPVTMADADQYSLTATPYVDRAVGWCEQALTGTLTLRLPDGDHDGVADEVDECLTAPGDENSTDGCPLVERRFADVAYADGVVTGMLTIRDSEDGGCTAADEVTLAPSGAADLASVMAVETTGAFTISMHLDDNEYELSADSYRDSTAGWCEAVSTTLVVETDLDDDGLDNDTDPCPGVTGPVGDTSYPGCPMLERALTAAYVNGAIIGQVSVPDVHQSPPGTCLATNVTAFTVAPDGSRTQVGDVVQTAADGAYEVAIVGGLPPGARYVASTQSHVADQVAACETAESAVGQVPIVVADPPSESAPEAPPVVVVDPPGGSVPELGPVLSGVKLTVTTVHVGGSPQGSRVARLKLTLNVAALVQVRVAGSSKATGKKVVARVSKSLPAGPAAIRLSGRVGKKRLPPGTYRVTVRATNAHGVSAVAAGRLKIKG